MQMTNNTTQQHLRQPTFPFQGNNELPIHQILGHIIKVHYIVLYLTLDMLSNRGSRTKRINPI